MLEAVIRAAEERFPVRVRGLHVEGFSDISHASSLNGSSALVNTILVCLLDRLSIWVSVYELASLGLKLLREPS